MLNDKALQPLTTDVYNRLIAALLESQCYDQAQQVFRAMPTQGEGSPNTITLNTFLAYHAKSKAFTLPLIVDTVKLFKARNLQPDATTFTAIVPALLKSGQQSAAHQALELMTALNLKPNQYTYGIIVENLTRGDEPAKIEMARELLASAEKKGVPLDEISYTALLAVYCRQRPIKPSNVDFDEEVLPPNLAQAEALATKMRRLKIPFTTGAYNALIAGHLATGSRSGARRAMAWFEAMRNATSSRTERFIKPETWFLLLDGLVAAKDWASVRAVMKHMDAAGFVPQTGALITLVDTIRRKLKDRPTTM